MAGSKNSLLTDSSVMCNVYAINQDDSGNVTCVDK